MKCSVLALILYTENTYMHTNIYDISQKTGNLLQHCHENVRSCIVPLLGVCCVYYICRFKCLQIKKTRLLRQYLRAYRHSSISQKKESLSGFLSPSQIMHVEPLWRDRVASADLKAFKNDCEVVKTEVMLIMFVSVTLKFPLTVYQSTVLR